MINNSFNDVGSLPRYRRPNKKWDALEPLADGIKGRHEKDYPDQAIADEITSKNPLHPVLKNITARDIRLFRTQGNRRVSTPRKTTAVPPLANSQPT